MGDSSRGIGLMGVHSRVIGLVVVGDPSRGIGFVFACVLLSIGSAAVSIVFFLFL